MEYLINFLFILVVILSFNLMIFIHELGHFWAARWRGLRVERFQIWFGKPIWSKTHNGVQYGLGWIPAGGYVALPQMAAMEAIEGETSSAEDLPPVKPLDKIIVAVAGPLFSLLLALTIALAVWKVGKPADLIPVTEIGYIKPDGPAAKAGFQLGDRILAVNGQAVAGFAGSLNCITEKIVLSEGDHLRFTVQRPGEATTRELVSSFETAPTPWYQRRAMRQIGISYRSAAVVGDVLPNSPAQRAGLVANDEVIAINQQRIYSPQMVPDLLLANQYQPLIATVKRNNEEIQVSITPLKPVSPADLPPMLGISWQAQAIVDSHLVYPNPLQQCASSVKMMLATIGALISPQSSIGVDQLSGPISIAKAKFELLRTDADGWRRLISFMVMINVNLAIFNMLPFPVLDGGHTLLSLMEMISGRRASPRILGYVQSACALCLMGLFLFITSKDIGGFFGGEKRRSSTQVIFPDSPPAPTPAPH